ncbi:Glycine dehydrogenase [decarboxylating] (glycine cleavage system P1 protein) [hydrothermal vent metagenome]|uniref:Glycine dehydrogenase [decarboxylating] (Glycine cleavage system P1 protein) n=1 Tax=hydrothermal vent metagenome TaxID=652676 RepID=A0A3B0TQZ7_9ZZZZ
MRYLPLNAATRADMAASIGVGGIDDLFADIPKDKRLIGDLDLPGYKGEIEVERDIGAMAARNVAAGSMPFFCGAGAYRHHVPATVDHLIQRSEFLTSYTPYQPEVSQGTLQMLFEFQTQVAALTGMEVANASMYDGSTAAAEAVLMAHRLTRRGRAIIAHGLHPHYREVIKNLSGFAGHGLECLEAAPGELGDIIGAIDADTACVVVQSPDVYGRIHDLAPIAEAAHAAGALVVAVFTEAMALGALKPPGEMGADIVAGEGQSIGNGLNFGGPYVGLFACRQKFIRQMPGRICGQTVDAAGARGFVLTLSTREQHIRRKKATSNICTNAGLCALAFSIHMSLLGEVGLRRVAAHAHANAVALAEKLTALRGVELETEAFFNEFTLKLPRPAAGVVEDLVDRGVLGGVPASRLEPARDDLANHLIIAATETNTGADIAAFETALGEVLK